MKKAEILYYVQKRKEGWDNSQIRKELVKEGYDKEDIFYILNDIDDAYVKSLNTKNDLSVNNVSLRILELSLGLVILLIGAYLLAACIINGPALLNLIIGISASSTGYYLSQKGLTGLRDIKNSTQEKIQAEKEMREDVLD